MMNGWFHSAGSARELISIDHFVDDYIFATDQNAYGTTFRLVSGIDSECMSDEELENVSARLLQAMRLAPESCVLKQILIKRRGCEITPSPCEQSENKTVAETEAKRRRHLETRHLSTVELFWTLYIQPAALKGLTKPEEHGAANARRVRKLRNAVTVLKKQISDITESEQIDCHAVARLYGFISKS